MFYAAKIFLFNILLKHRLKEVCVRYYLTVCLFVRGIVITYLRQVTACTVIYLFL